ncbi:MAG: isoprenylcysteine carboxylmethyltransferase family protein [Myxococcota bacterium]|jgi:protein-S-isoprenylcysteine O-methyltransferase Ste14|nr:isoprenylcysteine carboxylmethyltransferase family protein [Myxococcota bacterium]
MKRTSTLLWIAAALFFGGGSLLIFYAFLIFGSFNLVELGLDDAPALAFDAMLLIVFFLAHSILVRKGVRARLGKAIPADYYGAFYAMTSGVTLAPMVLFWQATPVMAEADSPYSWILRVVFILGSAGFYWGITSLNFFDPFGTMVLRLRLRNREPQALPLAIKGAYRWVRHPLYFFSMVMIWGYPVVTADRLLFNGAWTAWIVFATMLEERDLVRDFGDAYRRYQSQVPMLLPWKRPAQGDAESL